MPHGSGAVGIAGAGERVAADENLTAAERQRALHKEQGLEAFETSGKEGVFEKALLALGPIRDGEAEPKRQMLGDGREIGVVNRRCGGSLPMAACRCSRSAT
jgi:hypothetical protein